MAVFCFGLRRACGDGGKCDLDVDFTIFFGGLLGILVGEEKSEEGIFGLWDEDFDHFIILGIAKF